METIDCKRRTRHSPFSSTVLGNLSVEPDRQQIKKGLIQKIVLLVAEGYGKVSRSDGLARALDGGIDGCDVDDY